MKPWCGGAVLLSVLSFCSAAPLTCEKLLAPADQGPDFSGRWYLHAMSTDSCMLSNVIHTFMKPSIVMDFTLKETEKTYNATTTIKMLGFCANETETLSHEKNLLVDKKNNETDYLIMPSSCTDCAVLKVDESMIKALFLYSRNTTIGAADLQEFQTQATCLNLSSPQQLDTDYDFTNCKDIEESELTEKEALMLGQRLETLITQLMECLVRYISSWTNFST